jgi:hypothetical protein
MIEETTRRPRAIALRSNLPDIYPHRGNPRTDGHDQIFQSFGYEADQIRLALDGCLAAAMPAHPRFPFWACARWESDLGLSIEEGWPLAERVSRILARLRGFGTATRRRVAAVANSFENGQVLIDEDYESYVVTFRFISIRGEPPFLAAVQAAVEEIVPAHLLVKWEFTYTTYGMLTEAIDPLTSQHYTFAGLSAIGMTYLEISVFL